MFMGHYGISFAAKRAHQSLPLWLCFLAVQWLDFWWGTLVIMGVEKFRVGPGGLEFYYMPYSHGLAGALALSALLGLIAAAIWAPRWRTFLVVAALAFSHWLADLVVHFPDLPLYGDSYKIGFAVWKYPMISIPLELGMLWAGAFVYTWFVRAGSAMRAVWLWVFVALLTFEQLNVSFGWFGPFFAEPKAIAGLSVSIWAIAVVLAGLVDLTRFRPERDRTQEGRLRHQTGKHGANLKSPVMRQGGSR